MKLPEEEADKEIGKRLREKFEDYRVPVKDQVRVNIFAALQEPSNKLYWILAGGALLLIAAYFLGNKVLDRNYYEKGSLSAQNQARDVTKNRDRRKSVLESADHISVEIDSAYLNTDTVRVGARKISAAKADSQKQNGKKVNSWKTQNNRFLTSSMPYNVAIVPRQQIEDSGTNLVSKSDAETNNNTGTERDLTEQPFDLAFLAPVDSVKLGRNLKALSIPCVPENIVSEAIGNQRVRYGVKAVFSATVLQTFQLVNLSHSGSDRVQNFEFAPLLSSKSLSYKFTAGLEKKHTQLLASYQYYRNWNEFEIGTNQVIATPTGTHQYEMLRIGEKHVTDDRSNLIGIGIRQIWMLPQHILKNYSVNLGIEYTHIISKEEDLFWGNLGFYKQVYQSGRSRFEIGPYLQYSFVERKIAGQIWKYRPYQIGISLAVKMK